MRLGAAHRWVLVVAVLAVLCGAAPGRAAESGTVTYYLTYQGSASFSDSEAYAPNNHAYEQTASFSWRISVADTYATDSVGLPAGLVNQTGTVTGSGSLSGVDTESGQSTPILQCQFGPPSPQPSGAQWQGLALAERNPQTGLLQGSTELQNFNWVINCPTDQANGGPSTETGNPLGLMETGAAQQGSCWSFADDGGWDQPADQQVTAYGAGGGMHLYEASDNGSFTCNDTGVATRKLTATLIVSGVEPGVNSTCMLDPFLAALPDCAPPLPGTPDKQTLSRRVDATRKVLDDCLSDGPEFGILGGPRPNCDGLIADLYAAIDVFKNDPPDSHFDQIALPASFPSGDLGQAKCAAAVRAAVCARLLSAVRAYALAAGRVAEIWEALATTANRWGSAHAAFSSDVPGAPAGLYLQTALSKAYYGELGAALPAEKRAADQLVDALNAAGLEHRSLTRTLQARAQAQLRASGPPASLVKRVVADGLFTSAAAVRAAWLQLVAQLVVPLRLDVGWPISGVGSVPAIPGETYHSITLDDLAWIVRAVPGETGQDALSKDLQAAESAHSDTARRAALRAFVTDVGRHESGQLALLLRTAVAPLVS